MGSINGKWNDDEYSVIGDKGEIGFIDYQDDKSVCSYNPSEEGPVVVSVPFPFHNGNPQSVVVGETASHSITIKNTTDEAVDLWTKIYASTPENSFTLSLMEPPSVNGGNSSRGFLESAKLEDRMLQPGDSLTIWLNCKPMEIGLYTSVVHFDVGNNNIERVVFLLAEDKISRSLSSTKPYSRTTRKKQFNADSYVVGSRPIRKSGRVLKNRLPRYDIPKEMRELIESNQTPDAVNGGLTRANYSSYFKTMLMMEEIQMEQDMRSYDMEGVRMRKRGNFLSLVVPGLAERRPSLVYGDHIFAKRANEDETVQPFQGYIHRVEADEVYLKFDPQFHSCHLDGNLYDVHFTYNRVNMRRQYLAVDAAEDLETELLFPSECLGNRLIESAALEPITCNINEEQLCSIEMILGCKGAPPYLIYGPPGTGKTMTIVEAILQLYKYRKDTRILVCAPSNSAADHLLEKLLCEKSVIREDKIFRLNATSRPVEDVNSDHIRFCFFDEQIFKCPPLDALMRYRIIISTYMSACQLYAEGVERGHFSHIFLDEAGQASEPESMIPISKLCRRDTVVVLAGDPMQLGPVIYSRNARDHGLAKSYLERLFECECYCNEDENYITKLVRNYRCHPDILRLPSDLFYEGELIASKESNDDTTCLLSSVNLLPGRDFPVLFFGIQGCDEREGNNPSWFNRIEASKVVEIINKLIARGDLDEADIGVITPYRQQVMKLKKTLDDLEMPGITVGSVEQFQGQERRVIVVSTVRSTVKHNEFDRAHCLGFLSNPRRFNVAITRAISLLIIIGNPHIINKDRFWSKLLWYCADNESYQGCGLPEREDYADEYQMQEDGATNSYEQYDESPQNTEGVGWNGNLQNSEEGAGWNHEPFGTKTPKPVTDENEWGEGWTM